MNAVRRQLYNDPHRNERDYRNIVEMRVPDGGFGQRLDDIHRWHRDRFLEYRSGHGRTTSESFIIVSYILGRWLLRLPWSVLTI